MKSSIIVISFFKGGKKVIIRFKNFLRESKKTRNMAPLCVSLIIIISGMLAACNSTSIGIIGGADGPTSIYISDKSQKQIEQLFNSKTKYVGGASAVGKILSQCTEIKDVTYTGMELKTDEPPYGIIRNCEFSGEKIDELQLRNQACIILSLVENASYIQYNIEDKVYTYKRDELDVLFGKTLLEYSNNLDSFKELVIALTIPEIENTTLEQAVSNAILSENYGGYLGGECQAEGNIILKSEDIDNKTTVYVLAMYGEYGFENGIFTKVSGTGIIPIKITFEKEDKIYRLKEYKIPLDGSYYGKSIREMFPTELYNRAIFPSDNDIEICEAQEERYAKDYLIGIGRDAEVSANYVEKNLVKMNVDFSNYLLSAFGEYPYWIGDLEKIENGVRYIYDKMWQPDAPNSEEGRVTFTKYEYDTRKVVEQTIIEFKNGEMAYLKGTK